jgi:hypothetical protein
MIESHRQGSFAVECQPIPAGLRLATAIAAAALLAPACGRAAPASYRVEPSTLREVEARVIAAGQPATITCAPGVYPAFFRSAKFAAPVTAACDGATFPGARLAGATNFTLDGGTFSGRLVVSNCRDVAFRHLTFPPGSTGLMGRNCKGFTAEQLTITGSAAPLAFINVSDLKVLHNTITDYSGNAGIAAYSGCDILIKGNRVTGSRPPPKGVHPDAIQTADFAGAPPQCGTVEISGNYVKYVGQGIFGGGTPDVFKAYDNYVMVDYPNALTWKAKVRAEIGNNTLITLPTKGGHKPKFVNYGLRQAIGVAATDKGGNTINGARVSVK